ncbi:uncharacterized protein LOC141674256 [Apium graveolens]|uniref:uncharacterized protein LOC141674256 n=1 Tax=Apium graveolens TaxID=4045 RepID=UPI003D79705E
MWGLLRNFSRDSNLSWRVIGDMNNIISQEEKRGGAAYPQRLIDGFNKALEDAELKDLDLYGHPFKWERGRDTEVWIEIRLDRALSPILLDPKTGRLQRSNRRFRFENAWLLEPLCSQIVKDNWEVDITLNIMQKIALCGESLEVWGKEITGCFNRRIRDCKERLQQLRSARDAQSSRMYKEAKQKLFLILNQRKIFWKQRSKQLWLQSGDKNTKYFHASCNVRRRTNHIQKLKDTDGSWVDWQTNLQQLITRYYQDLFTATKSSEVIDCVTESVS